MEAISRLTASSNVMLMDGLISGILGKDMVLPHLCGHIRRFIQLPFPYYISQVFCLLPKAAFRADSKRISLTRAPVSAAGHTSGMGKI
jgi:hypothetical protein